MKRILVSSLLSFYSIISFATSISGGIYSSATWTLSNSPYIVSGDVVVFDGATLTIEPGVEVRVDSAFKIEIRGKILAEGTSTSKITFKANATNAGRNYWKGIVFGGTFQSTTHQATFDHCIISNASKGLDMNNATQGPYRFTNTTFSNNQYVNDDGGMGGVLFDNCSILNNYRGISGLSYFGGTISNCIFDGNDYGVESSDTLVNCIFKNHTSVAASPYGYTNNCEFYNNNTGVKCYFNSANKTFINNKLKNNVVGLEIEVFGGPIDIYNNEFCDNTQYNVKLIHISNADLSNNCWCLNDSAAIRAKIYDGYVDISKGLVTFTPFNTGCTNFPASVGETVNNEDFKIFPNPVHGEQFIIAGSIPFKSYDIVITDAVGRRVSYTGKQKRENEYSVQLDQAVPGTYLVTLTNKLDGKAVTQKILVK